MIVNLDSTMDILEPSKAMWVKVVVRLWKTIAIGCMSYSAMLKGLIDSTMVPTITLAPHVFLNFHKKEILELSKWLSFTWFVILSWKNDTL
jgi:hypothetical protein